MQARQGRQVGIAFGVEPRAEQIDDFQRRGFSTALRTVIGIPAFWIGIYPKPFLSRIEPAVKQVLTQVSRARSAELTSDFRVVSPEELTTQQVGVHPSEEEEAHAHE